MDFVASEGTPVYASLTGKVVLAQELFYTGKTVVIDHGKGLFTLYAHLSRISVKEGEMVKRGKIIGNVGSTGRSTGPHLHFGVYLVGMRIDPDLVFRLKL
ncbi:MAG: M23 family metallopeptidase [Persephonella sp.]|nr:M23 family metallopeptidase [Persephonella sp.]